MDTLENSSCCQYDIAELFGRAYIKSQRADLAINGFRATGIYPIDRGVFQEHDFIQSPDEINNINNQFQPADTMQPQLATTSTISPENNNYDSDDSDRTFYDEPESTANDLIETEAPVAVEKITNEYLQGTKIVKVKTLV